MKLGHHRSKVQYSPKKRRLKVPENLLRWRPLLEPPIPELSGYELLLLGVDNLLGVRSQELSLSKQLKSKREAPSVGTYNSRDRSVEKLESIQLSDTTLLEPIFNRL